MDFLLDNPLATLDGPAFLVLYVSVIILLAIALSVARANSDRSDDLNIPAIPPAPDPYEIAFLRGGANEVARVIIFSLIQKGFVEIVSEGKTSHLKQASLAPGPNGLSVIEQTALDWLGLSREAGEVFEKKYGLVEQIEPFLSVYRDSLEKKQVLTSLESSRRLRKYGISAATFVCAIGGYKVLASIAYGHFNVAFTIVASFVGFLVIGAISTLPRLTKLGKKYLERLGLAFEDLKYRSQAPYIRTTETKVLPRPAMAGVDPLLLSVGLFGPTILTGTVFDDYNMAFQRSQQQAASAACGGACGGGCSSGSDGGGSSCGGGCGGGGCGGGGCGG